ncbi:MAG: nucleotidyltransferase domain-containing protein [Bacillota bacterium]
MQHEQRNSLLAVFAENSSVLTVWLIGSHETVLQHTDSDIDFAVLFERDTTLKQRLLFEIEVCEILHTDNVDVVNLNEAPILFASRTLDEGRLLFERNREQTSDFIEYVLTYYYDEKLRAARYFKDYRAA